jgi:hypothetical protein
MTTPPPPAEGPASAADVAVWLQDTGEAAAEKYAGVTAAANAVVRRWLVPRASGQWREDHVRGTVMLAARLWRRRNSPEGVATFTADGAVYVQRNDPDIALLLQLGQHAPPVVG